MQRPLRSFLITCLVMIAVFISGIYVGGHYYRLWPLTDLLPDGVSSAFFPGDDLVQLQREVENILDNNFYEPIDRSVLETGAMEGMVSSLGDPYSEYFSPEAYNLLRIHTDGVYVGIGVVIEDTDAELKVVSTLPGSPAEGAGIKEGDIIIAVDGQSLAGMSSEEATALIKGDEGTTVTIRVRRGEGEELDFNIERKRLEVPVVEEKVLDAGGRRIGYISLTQFTKDSGDKVAGALDKLSAEGVEGVILDLRNNGGGLLDESVGVSSAFIESGVIVSTVGRDSDATEYQATGNANEKIPLVVLVNSNSASASEITAGAIKDDKRGAIVGEKTYGKGVVQRIVELTNGGAIKYTSAVYYTPAGTNINNVGIEPDIVVADDPDTPADEQLDRALAYFSG